MLSSSRTPATVRWQYILGPYSTYWYLRCAIRWLSIVASVACLIILGVIRGDWSYESGPTLAPDPIISIAAPLLSFVTSVIGTTLLYLLRLRKCINPGWLLAGDFLTALFLVIVLAYDGVVNFSSWSRSNDQMLLEVPWGFSLILAVVHSILFCCDVWEINTFRRMMKEQCGYPGNEDPEYGHSSGSKPDSAEPEEIELQSTTPKTQDRNEEPPAMPPRAENPENAMVDMPGTLRIELPNGRILELPEGCRVQLSVEHQAELPNKRLRIITQSSQLDSSSMASTQWYGSSPVAPSYKTQE